MNECYVIRNVDEDYENVFAIVAESVGKAKQYGASLLDCEYIDVRIKKHKNVNVKHLPHGEIVDLLWSLKQGLYGWVEGDCPRCKTKDVRIEWDNGFSCSSCEDDVTLNVQRGKKNE